MTVMGDAAMNRLSDRGSIPLSSIKGKRCDNPFSDHHSAFTCSRHLKPKNETNV